MLSVLTYNTRYGKKIFDIATWIETFSNPIDIICLQEFPLHKTGIFLSHLSSSYDYTSAISFTKDKKPYGQITLFMRKTIRLSKTDTLSLGPGGYIERKIFKNEGERSALLTTFVYKQKSFSIINTHLVSYAMNKSRIKQLERIVDFLSKTNSQTDSPIVLLGDFNYSSLFKRTTLLEFMQQYEFSSGTEKLATHKVFMFTSRITHQVDYIFAKECTVNNARVIRKNYSDHYPIYFSLAI